MQDRLMKGRKGKTEKEVLPPKNKGDAHRKSPHMEIKNEERFQRRLKGCRKL